MVNQKSTKREKREPSIELEKIVSENGDSVTMPNTDAMKQI